MDFFVCNYDKHKKIWSTPEVEAIYNFECSLGRILFTLMQNHPSAICQIDAVTNKATTNREAISWGTRLALYFKSQNLKHNDIIGISACNSTYVLPTVLGSVFNCTPFHAVNPTYDENTLSHCFGLTKPKVIFCDGRDYEKIRKSTKSFKPQIYTLTDHIKGVPNIEDLLQPLENEHFYQPEDQILGAKQTIAILCSSGTTGMPKAVCLCSSSILFDNPFINSESVILVFSGIDWFTGLSYLITSCATGNKRIITTKPFSSEHFVEIVQKFKVTKIFLPPRHIAALVESPLVTKEALKLISFTQCGGGAISENNLRRFKDLLSEQAIISVGYGFTEFAGVSANFDLAKTNTVGKLVPNIKLRIVDDNGTNLGPNAVGEILVYRRSPWNGYYGNPIETQRMIDNQGWYHSGDLGYMDDNNYLYIVDRKKEILKYQGFHYWPKEIEDAIVELPDVIETCVVGIPDERNGDAAGALVVKSKGSLLTEQEIIAHVAKRLVSTYKQLHAGVYFVDVIPHNANGKISRNNAKPLLLSLRERNVI